MKCKEIFIFKIKIGSTFVRVAHSKRQSNWMWTSRCITVGNKDNVSSPNALSSIIASAIMKEKRIEWECQLYFRRARSLTSCVCYVWPKGFFMSLKHEINYLYSNNSLGTILTITLIYPRAYIGLFVFFFCCSKYML